MKKEPDHLPPLSHLGSDLRRISIGLKIIALGMTPLGTVMFFYGWHWQWWWLMILALYVIGFFTYGSTSHDLVHRNFGLSPFLNDILLSFTELLALRSGHAYRCAHMNHHQTFPKPEDFEGAPAQWSFIKTALTAPFYFLRIFCWAFRRYPAQRFWMIAEALFIVGYWIISFIFYEPYPQLLFYAVAMWLSSWAYPFLLVYIVHHKKLENALQQTVFVRGRWIPMLLLQHSYHLEHHLYPQVPAWNYSKLAQRLDPYFSGQNIQPYRIP